MPIRFSETSLATGPDRYRLLGQSRQVILELQGEEIEEAIRGGFLDPNNLHATMFVHARMLEDLRTHADDIPADPPRADGESDTDFLSRLNIRWN